MIRSSFRILVILVIMGLVFLFMNKDHVSSKERLAGSRLVICSGKIRPEVGKSLLSKQPVKTDIKNPCPKFVSELHIDDHGVINMKNNQYSIEVSFTPVITESTIHWRCLGSPEEFLPRRCRGNE